MKLLKAYRDLQDILQSALKISRSETRKRIITQIRNTQFERRQAQAPLREALRNVLADTCTDPHHRAEFRCVIEGLKKRIAAAK